MGGVGGGRKTNRRHKTLIWLSPENKVAAARCRESTSPHENSIGGSTEISETIKGGSDKGDLRDSSVSLGGVSCSLLSSGQNEFEVLRVVDSIKHGQDGASRVAKDMLNTVL